DMRTTADALVGYLRRSDRDVELGGWIAGMLIFPDAQQRIARELEEFPEAIPFALDAVAAGIAANVSGPRRLWLLVERLAVRSARLPPGLAPLLVAACIADYGVTRGAAVRIAALVGAPVRDALVAARDGAPRHHHSRYDSAI